MRWRWEECGERYFISLPKNASKSFCNFFKSIGLPHICFHCLRVTFISRLCQNEVPEYAVARLVGHRSIEVNRLYQRLPPTELSKYSQQVVYPAAIRTVPSVSVVEDEDGTNPPRSLTATLVE
jgi:integrase